MAAGQGSLKTFRGSCHCGAYIFDVELPEAVDKATECNCSVCSRKAAIWAFPAQPKFLKGDPETLTSYTFGRKLFNHKFCPTCGICPIITGYVEPPKEGEEPKTGVNLRSIQHGQGLDVWKLNPTPIDGASFPPLYQPHEYTGPEPKAEVEGGQVYTGSCHCGAVRVALRSEPLDKTYPHSIMECNCSSCNRNGCTWIYPSKDQVEVQGKENMGVYTFGLHAWGKTFCKTCGTPIGNEPMPLTNEQIARLPEGYIDFFVNNSHMRAINVRIIDGVDVKGLNIVRSEGYDRPGGPAYVEPQPQGTRRGVLGENQEVATFG